MSRLCFNYWAVYLNEEVVNVDILELTAISSSRLAQESRSVRFPRLVQEARVFIIALLLRDIIKSLLVF